MKQDKRRTWALQTLVPRTPDVFLPTEVALDILVHRLLLVFLVLMLSLRGRVITPSDDLSRTECDGRDPAGRR